MTRVAANGQEMWDLLRCKHGRVVVSSCIYEREMRPREDLSLGDPPRLLFVGYLRPEKGISYLLDAFESLRREAAVEVDAGRRSRSSDQCRGLCARADSQ